MRSLLLLLLVLAPDSLLASEEAGAKAMFDNPAYNALHFSPNKGKAKPAEGDAHERGKPQKQRPRSATTTRTVTGDTFSSAEAEAKRSIGIRFWIRQVDAHGRVLDEVDVGQIFRSGDRIQLVVEANTNAYLAVAQEGSDGRAGLLFPPHESELGVDRVLAHAKLVVPDTRQSFTFDHNPGTERLFIVLVSGRDELATLPLRRKMEAADIAALRRLAARETGAKNLVIESFADHEEDPATYAVNRVGSAIVQEIALVHER